MPVPMPVTNSTVGTTPVSATIPTANQILRYDATSGMAHWCDPDYIVTFAGRATPGSIVTTPPAHVGDAVISIFDAAMAGLPLNTTSFVAVAIANGVSQTDMADLNAHSYLALVRPKVP